MNVKWHLKLMLSIQGSENYRLKCLRHAILQLAGANNTPSARFKVRTVVTIDSYCPLR